VDNFLTITKTGEHYNNNQRFEKTGEEVPLRFPFKFMRLSPHTSDARGPLPMMEIEVFLSTNSTRKQETALKYPTLRTTCILESSNSKELSDLETKVSKDAETSIRVSIPALRVLRLGFFFFFDGFPALSLSRSGKEMALGPQQQDR
jgi:hypothetical protein